MGMHGAEASPDGIVYHLLEWLSESMRFVLKHFRYIWIERQRRSHHEHIMMLCLSSIMMSKLQFMPKFKVLLIAFLLACGGAVLRPVVTDPPLHETNLSAKHVASCEDAACGNGSNPPLGGDHCSQTLSCRTYDSPQSRCKWIHNLEHGHAVLLYNCPEGCVDDVAKLAAVRDASTNKVRIIVTSDASLSARFAAIVWGWGWTGDAVDEAAISQVLAKQDVDAPEKGLGCAP